MLSDIEYPVFKLLRGRRPSRNCRERFRAGLAVSLGMTMRARQLWSLRRFYLCPLVAREPRTIMTLIINNNLPTSPGTAPDTNIQRTTPIRLHGKFNKKEAAKKKPHNL
jgi:hypothetical protein